MESLALRCHLRYLRMELGFELRGHPSNCSLNYGCGGKAKAKNAKQNWKKDWQTLLDWETLRRKDGDNRLIGSWKEAHLTGIFLFHWFSWINWCVCFYLQEFPLLQRKSDWENQRLFQPKTASDFHFYWPSSRWLCSLYLFTTRLQIAHFKAFLWRCCFYYFHYKERKNSAKPAPKAHTRFSHCTWSKSSDWCCTSNNAWDQTAVCDCSTSGRCIVFISCWTGWEQEHVVLAPLSPCGNKVHAAGLTYSRGGSSVIQGLRLHLVCLLHKPEPRFVLLWDISRSQQELQFNILNSGKHHVMQSVSQNKRDHVHSAGLTAQVWLFLLFAESDFFAQLFTSQLKSNCIRLQCEWSTALNFTWLITSLRELKWL